MPSITHTANVPWLSYHETTDLVVADQATLVRDAGPVGAGPALFAATAAVIKPLLAHAIHAGTAIGAVGSGWSLSDIVGMASSQLATDQLDGLAWLDTGDLHHHSKLRADHCVYAGGGTKAWQLVQFAEASNRSIKTCGSYLGQSLAGSIATSVNGSALGYGGFQNQVRGIHLLTGDKSVWIERASARVLNDATAHRFADEVIHSDAVFEDCLVGLGGMGIVNGLVFELVAKDNFEVVRRKKQVDAQWLAMLARGDFLGVARLLGYDLEPAYYEVQVDPFDRFGTPALHTLYFRVGGSPSANRGPAIAKSLDGIAQMSAQFGLSAAPAIDGATAPPPAEEPIPTDIFKHYAEHYFVETAPTTIGAGPNYSWGQIHANPPHPELKAQIYSAAMAVDRLHITRSLPVLCDAVAGMPLRHILYTLRFVSNAAGSMAFTRFPESVVVDMEGLMQSPYSHEAGKAACAALDAAHIDYCMHWGKILAGDAHRIERQFGPACEPDSRLGRWQRTRERLLSPAARAVLWNRALRAWQLA